MLSQEFLARFLLRDLSLRVKGCSERGGTRSEERAEPGRLVTVSSDGGQAPLVLVISSLGPGEPGP